MLKRLAKICRPLKRAWDFGNAILEERGKLQQDANSNSSITVELPPSVINRLKENSFGRRSLADEAVRMLRYAFKQMFPARSPDEWRNIVGKEDRKDLFQALIWIIKGKNESKVVPVDQPQKLMLQLTPDLAGKLEDLAQSRQITVPEAALYTIEYALTEVFPPKPVEELRNEVADSWRRIFRAIWRR